MRALGLLTAALIAAAALPCLLATTDARADNMDPALGRLTIDDSCRTAVNGAGQYYDPTSQFRRCQPNDAAFAKLVAQLGTAVAPIASHAARTTGFGGYRFGIQAAYTTIDSGADYWKRGTQGPVDESTKRASVVNNEPDDVLQLYTIYLAKGFPFGLELGGAFGYLANTEIISGGGDVRLAIFEGFRDSIPGYIPDIGVGGQVRTMTGTSEIKLTVASLDAEISKPIPIAGTLTLQPHVGYQLLWIFGDSGLIDLTPNTDPLALCDYQGDNNPATPDPSKTDPMNPDPNALDGQPVCNGSSADFNNNVVFNRIRLNRHRINFGVQLRFQMLHFGIHVLTDIVDPVAANPRDGNLFDQDTTHIEDATDPSDPSGRTKFVGLHRLEDDPRTDGDDAVERQWTIALELGAIF